jgi:hypothetical protein
MSENPEITPEPQEKTAIDNIMPIFKKVLNAHFHYDFVDEPIFGRWIASHDNLDEEVRDTFIDLLTELGVFFTRENASELANFMKNQDKLQKFAKLTEDQQQDLIKLYDLLNEYA